MLILQGRFIHAKNKALRAAVMICISTLGAFSFALAQSSNNPDQEIAQARTKYEQGEFNAAIEIFNRCMQQDGLTAAQKMQVHKGLASVYLAKDYHADAETHIDKMFELDPDYHPDPSQEIPDFVRMVKTCKEKIVGDGRFILFKGRHLARRLDENFKTDRQQPLRVAPGNFTYQAVRISSPFLYYFQNTIEHQIVLAPRFQMVKREDLQKAVQTRGIAVTARLKPNSPEALQEFGDADAALMGKCWDESDSLLAIRLELIGRQQTALAAAETRINKKDIPPNWPLLPPNFDEVKNADEFLSDQASSAKLEIKLWVDRLDGAVYQKGEKMTAYVRANRDCHLYLIYHDADGNDLLILPNRLRPNHQITGGKVYEIPSRADQFDFSIVAPFGAEILKAFASTQPLPELAGKEISGGIKKLKLSAADLAKMLRGVALTAREAELVEAERAEASCVVTTVEK
jgi:tetratricopeptide (TPR) repeat protein